MLSKTLSQEIWHSRISSQFWEKLMLVQYGTGIKKQIYLQSKKNLKEDSTYRSSYLYTKLKIHPQLHE